MIKNNIKELYMPNEIQTQTLRYKNLLSSFEKHFNDSNVQFFSSPGRTEIGGNHTDHNNGKVVAASINLDAIAAVQKTNSNKITVFSDGFPEPFIVDISNLKKIKIEEGTTNSLIRGIAAGFASHNFEFGGFNACITSDVLQGSGLSSSASIEVLIGHILNVLYNAGSISAQKIAQIGQYSENMFFGKPCGLMDQMACAIGNIISIDFENSANPKVIPIDFDFSTSGHRLIVLDTGGNHADLTEDYASIPIEMKEVAKYFNKDNCREINETDFYNNLKNLKATISHRAILRAIHFFNENKRVDSMVKALQNSNFPKFLNCIKKSGDSSYKYLQNIFTNKNPEEQSMSLALALTEDFLNEINAGACRVHGGGFAGTIQIILPDTEVNDYINFITPIFGKNSAQVLNIRSIGVTEVEL